MNRQTKRAMKRQMGANATNEMAEKVSQFNKLPESCSACQESFDKKDKDMLNSWHVVARQDVVRLFCPDCIEKTKEVINERTENQ